jgi:hypothetical protein
MLEPYAMVWHVQRGRYRKESKNKTKQLHETQDKIKENKKKKKENLITEKKVQGSR